MHVVLLGVEDSYAPVLAAAAAGEQTAKIGTDGAAADGAAHPSEEAVSFSRSGITPIHGFTYMISCCTAAACFRYDAAQLLRASDMMHNLQRSFWKTASWNQMQKELPPHGVRSLTIQLKHSMMRVPGLPGLGPSGRWTVSYIDC